MSTLIQSLTRRIGYMLSLPERTVRSIAAVVGGASTLLTETLFPEALRGTTLYRVFVGDTQQFLIRQLAGMKDDDPADGQTPAPASDYAVRKTVGAALETAGLFAMHLSPLWVFAIAGDAAAGTTVFLQRLTAHLKANGVIPEDTRVDGLADLLGAIQEASRASAGAVDTPPLSAEELGRLASELTDRYGRIFGAATGLLPRLETLWKRMEQLADVNHVSLGRISGLLTLDLARLGGRGMGAAVALGQTGADIVADTILDSYAETLETIARQGLRDFVGTRLAPFVTAAARHFSPDAPTWTQSLLGLGETPAPATGEDPKVSGGSD